MNALKKRGFKKGASDFFFSTGMYEHNVFSKSVASLAKKNFVERYDFCGHFRKNFTGWQATDSGIMSFNLNKNCRFFMEKLMEHFLSGEVFKNKRWDDGYVFDVMTYKCRDWLRCCGLTKIFGCDFNLNEYFFHDKGWTTIQG